AFDITVGPLVDLWGFTKLDFSVPAGSKIKQTLKLVGADKIILNQNNNVIEFKLSGMKIDLGGIAKGYALDRCVEELKKNNVKSCLINAGGQVYALGKRSGRYWKVAIRSPLKKRAVDILELTDQSVSTSGNYEQFFFKGGKRYCHIIDPRTGYPVDKKIASVTIISDSATTADILSTAVFVLGEQDAEEILKNFPGIKLRIYDEFV
ncbi:MAG: FAD:protein FMN transferase, partial [Candidatus Omnitrophica bacterium]|nr:FAD:protein FMN transferase [Candidatus Omnitrophota bacterium]